MSRAPKLDPNELAPPARQVYDDILASRGSIEGPFGIWLHSAEFADRAQRLGEFVRYQTSLTERTKELAILVTAAFWGAELEWRIHERVALEVGITRAQIDAIRDGDLPSLDDHTEEAACRYVHELLRHHQVSDATFDAAREAVSTQGTVELTGLVGYYSLVALSLNAFAVED